MKQIFLKPSKSTWMSIVAFAIAFPSASYAQAPQITTLSPDRFSMTAATNTTISVQFDQPMNAATLQAGNFLVYGERTGFHAGNYAYQGGSRIATFTSNGLFQPGERVHVILTTGITRSNGIALATPFVWTFFIRALPGTQEFSLTRTENTDDSPHYVAVGDIDEDEDMDIVIPHSRDDYATAWTNDGNVDFTQIGTLDGDSGGQPRQVTLGDFDADGDLDAAMPNPTNSNMTIFRNDGNGAMTAIQTRTMPAEPVWAASADLNGDGVLDLATASAAGSTMSVFLGNGDGTFQGNVDYPLGGRAACVAFADFDLDGDMDAVLTRIVEVGGDIVNSTVGYFPNNGNGTFGTLQTFATGVDPRAVTVQDFNGDGRMDVATSNRVSESISVLLNSGNANNIFSAATDFPAGNDGDDTFDLVAGDYDGDLDPDIAVCNRLADNIVVMLNNGGSFAIDSTYSTGSQPRGINAGDFDGDGVLDLAVANREGDTFQVFTNTAGPDNIAPAQSALVSPAANAHLNPNQTAITLTWNVPIDIDGDNLHFIVEVSQSAAFASNVITADSRNSTAGFSPTPPVTQGTGSVSYAISTDLADGVYYWRIKAHDGLNTGNPSAPRRFVVDTSAPNIDAVSLLNPPPNFAPNWYNGNSVNSVDYQVQYDEPNADRAVFTLGDLGGDQTVSNIASGTDQTASVSIDLSGAGSDGTFPLAVAVFDSATNQATDNSLSLGLDSTPPSGTTASSPDTSRALTFTVSWDGGSDGSGSGLSGSYNVQVQVDGGAWTPWRINFPGTSSSFTGQNGRTYRFEAAASDNVGNAAAFANMAETTTFIDTAQVTTPPNKPVNLAASGANPSPWQNSTNFLISWQAPLHPVSIARAYYKIGEPPTSNNDYTDSNTNTSFTVSTDQENGVNLHLWLEDVFGNVNYNNYATVMLRYDITPPTGTQASSPSVSSSTNFTVSWFGSGSDAGSGLSGIVSVRVQTNGGPWSDWLTTTDPSAEYVGEDGNTYGFEAASLDNAGNIEAFLSTAETSTQVDLNAVDLVAPGPPINLAAGGANPSPWQNDSKFMVTWQLPNDQSGIAKTYIQLGTGDPQVFDEALTSTEVTVTQENGQDLYVWFEDGLGNVTFANNGRVTLRYDATSPQITQTAFSNADYAPNWFNSNITTLAQLSLSYTELYPQQIDVTSTDLNLNLQVDSLQTGTASVQIGLNIGGLGDGDYTANVILSDSAGNMVQRQISLSLDISPPSGTVAISADTSQLETFTVYWGDSGSDNGGSGLSGAYTVRVRVNGGGWSTWLDGFTGTSNQYPGRDGNTYSFEVAAIDNVGNIEALQNTAESTTVVDTNYTPAVGPIIQHSPPLVVDQGQDATIVAQLPSNARILYVRLYYRQGGQIAFDGLDMNNNGSNSFSTTIPAAVLGTTGIHYYIEASNGNALSYYPSANWLTQPSNLSVRIVGIGDNQGLGRNQTIIGGTEARNYRMISVPLNLENANPLAVLEDDLGRYSADIWRLFQYRSGTNDFREYPNIDDFAPGRAFWLIVKDNAGNIDSGVGSSVPTNEPFQIKLNSGWTDIGHPFTFPVSLADIQVVSGDPDNIAGPYTYNQQWLLPSDIQTLDPWEGYSFRSETDDVTIAIKPNAAGPAITQKTRFAINEWQLNIRAYCGATLDESSKIGVNQAAALAWDPMDYPAPPFISDYVTVQFNRPEWNKFGGVFKTDFRPPSKAGLSWKFEVATNVKDQAVSLQIDNLAALPAQFKAVLFDAEVVRTIELTDGAYQFVPNSESLSRSFELVIGTPAYLDQANPELSFVPKSYQLSQNFPNPFNGGTSMTYKIPEKSQVAITVHNILGQLVRTLVDNTVEPGVYRINWDGRGNDGREISTGVYFIRIQANQFHQIRKALHIR